MLSHMLRAASSPPEYVLAGSFSSETTSSNYSYSISYVLNPSTTRVAVIGIAAGTNPDIEISSVSVGGVNASRITTPVYNPNVGSISASIEWWQVAIPSGTNGTVSYSSTGGSVSRTASVAYILDFNISSSLTLIGSNQRTSSGSISVNTEQNSILLAMAYVSSPTSELTWSGLNKDSYFEIQTNGRFVGSASHFSTTQQTPRDVSITFNGGSFTTVQVISVK
jgi:hypothetical protein